MFGGGDCIAIVSVHNSKFYVFSWETILAIKAIGGPQTGQKQKFPQQCLVVARLQSDSIKQFALFRTSFH